jgi:translation initiation factor 1A
VCEQTVNFRVLSLQTPSPTLSELPFSSFVCSFVFIFLVSVGFSVVCFGFGVFVCCFEFLFSFLFSQKYFFGEEMPKNKGKGGKNRKRGKNEAEDEKRELVFKEDGQEYAQVLRMLGNGRCEALCIDGSKRLCHIRGKMHKKVWIASGDIILVGLRDYQDDKADVILKYQPDEARLLKAYGELPDNVRLNEGIAGGMDEEEDGGGDDYIEFEDEDIDRI